MRNSIFMITRDIIQSNICKKILSIFFFEKSSHIHSNIFFHRLKVKLVTVVEGDPKAPLSIVTTPRCRGGHYSIPLIVSLYS